MRRVLKWTLIPALVLTACLAVPAKSQATGWSISVSSGYYPYGGYSTAYGRSYYRSPYLDYRLYPRYGSYYVKPYVAYPRYYSYYPRHVGHRPHGYYGHGHGRGRHGGHGHHSHGHHGHGHHGHGHGRHH